MQQIKGYEIHINDNLERRDIKLNRRDIQVALESYTARNGALPGVAVLHPVNVKLSEYLPDNTKVIYKGGCLAFEIWLADTEPDSGKQLKQQLALINSGSHFYCFACLEAIPVDDVSPDGRYCINCFEFLQQEAELLPETKRPRWIPKASKNSALKTIHVPSDDVLILSTVNDKKTTVDKIGAVTGLSKRGRKKAALPVESIRKMAAAGMGSKRIAAELLKQGIPANYRTIARIISQPDNNLL